MSEWKEYRLGDLGILQRGRSRHRPRYAFHLYGGRYPFIQTGEIREASKYIRKYERTYNDAGLEQSKLWPKDTLCITIAANIAEIAILNFDACFPDSVLGFIPDSKIANLDFIYYTLKHFQRELKHIGEGSVQDNINLGTFENILFPIPALSEQRSIASILSSLDDKIDLLHRQNQTLEKMAETLFRQWFVEEANTSSLSQIIYVQNGYAFKSKDFQEDGRNGVIKIKNISGGIIDIDKTDFIDDRVAKSIHERFRICKGDILIAMTGAEIGKLGIVPNTDKNLWLNQRVGLIKERFSGSKYLAYLQLKSDFGQDYIENTATGSAQPNISSSGIENCGFPEMPGHLLEKYSLQISELYNKIIFNLGQINMLTTLRDSLLPKLMSGEVRVDMSEKVRP